MFTFSLSILLLLAGPVFAIEAFQAQGIEVYRGSSIEPYQGSSITPQQSPDVQPDRGTRIEPYRGGMVEVDPPAQEVKRNDPAPATGYGRPAYGQNAAEEQRQTEENRRTAEVEVEGKVKELIGLWQTNVPGAVYTTPSAADGWAILHVSPGAKAGLLRLKTNGTYTWESYGGKQGRWVESGDPSYPIILIDTVENRQWRVGFDPKRPAIFIWDGSIWYEGVRAEIRR